MWSSKAEGGISRTEQYCSLPVVPAGNARPAVYEFEFVQKIRKSKAL